MWKARIKAILHKTVRVLDTAWTYTQITLYSFGALLVAVGFIATWTT